MAKRVKIFKTNKTPSDMENEVNNWLQENPNVITMFSSGLSATSGTSPVLIVFYESQTDDMGQALQNTKRQNERIVLFEIVDYSVDGMVYRDFMEDLSEGGMLIKTSNAISIGKELMITLMPPEQERSIKIKGKVVRSVPDGIGVKFVKESEVQSEVIRAIIKKVQQRR